METAKSFHTEGNFLAEEIQTRVTHTVNRFNDECLAQFLLSSIEVALLIRKNGYSHLMRLTRKMNMNEGSRLFQSYFVSTVEVCQVTFLSVPAEGARSYLNVICVSVLTFVSGTTACPDPCRVAGRPWMPGRYCSSSTETWRRR